MNEPYIDWKTITPSILSENLNIDKKEVSAKMFKIRKEVKEKGKLCQKP